jgi:S-DNA-T family DNA segregation ATPase FtsK/SpoIIIE
MSATSARVAVIPGRNAIGIELPNPNRETVYLRDLLSSNEFTRARMALPLALGESIEGQPMIGDLGKMPHLLIAGTTGSGKSVGINAMILSLMFKLPPEKCRFIMIDPKMLELSIYEGIPHLLSPVVTDPQKAVLALKWVVREMESRYELMSKMGVRNIAGFNQKAEDAASKGEHLTRQVQTGWNKETGEAVWETEAVKPEPMPHIVVVIDEMADLMLVAGKDIESAVQRIAQMARAAGIHLITATQRPSVDVITGTIKANFPTRISYMVTTKIDSRTILGEQGAEQLLGMGDLLWMQSGGKIIRVHGPFVKDEEVERVVNWLKDQGTPQYVEGITDPVEEEASVADAAFGTSSGDPEEDMYREAVAAVVRDKRPTTSYVQRVLRIGYNRAASMIERMEREGVISAADHAGKRQILSRDGRTPDRDEDAA